MIKVLWGQPEEMDYSGKQDTMSFDFRLGYIAAMMKYRESKDQIKSNT